MHQMTYYHLILRYPGMRQFISRCHIGNYTSDLCDAIISLREPEGVLYV